MNIPEPIGVTALISSEDVDRMNADYQARCIELDAQDIEAMIAADKIFAGD